MKNENQERSPEKARTANVRRAYRATKRAFDVIVSMAVLVLASPLLVVAALAVKTTSPGPVLYRARRAGLGGSPFVMFKLRTMRLGPETPDRRVTEARDERVTRVGQVLRKFKIDELPQFWNVLRGDISIVGPRPEDWDIVQNHFTQEQRRTLSVRPGIASPADLRWYPDLTYHDPPPEGVPIQEWYLARHLPAQLGEAARYVDAQSWWADLQVIAGAVFCVLVRSWWPPERRPPCGAELDGPREDRGGG